jgi:hypothetical protein
MSTVPPSAQSQLSHDRTKFQDQPDAVKEGATSVFHPIWDANGSLFMHAFDEKKKSYNHAFEVVTNQLKSICPTGDQILAPGDFLYAISVDPEQVTYTPSDAGASTICYKAKVEVAPKRPDISRKGSVQPSIEASFCLRKEEDGGWRDHKEGTTVDGQLETAPPTARPRSAQTTLDGTQGL